MKTLFVVGTVVALALGVTAVAMAASHATKRQASTVKISTRNIAGLGTIIVDGKGRTLYMFAPDKRKSVTCHKTCAKIWPPVFVPAGAKLVAGGSAKQALLGSDKDSTGGRVATYNHWPLYLYLGDRKPGTAAGQALNLNGGLWYVLSSTGALIKHKPGAGGGGGGGGGTNCSDDDGDGDGTAGGPDDGDGCI